MPIHYYIWGASAAQATAFATHENIIYGKTMREQHVGTIIRKLSCGSWCRQTTKPDKRAYVQPKFLKIIRRRIVDGIPPNYTYSQKGHSLAVAKMATTTAITHVASSPTSRLLRALEGQTLGLRSKTGTSVTSACSVRVQR
jgi:hypothetical protein